MEFGTKLFKNRFLPREIGELMAMG